MLINRCVGLLMVFALAAVWSVATAGPMVLVKEGGPAVPIVLPADAPAATTEAAQTLALYIEKITGQKPATLQAPLSSVPDSAIWIGTHDTLATLMPAVSLKFSEPEEILIASDGRHLVIAGRDVVVGDKQVQHGTANAIYTFIEKYLQVRWLWPGPLGEDVPASKTLALEPMEYRHHPVFRQRLFSRGMYPAPMEDWTRAWFRHQRVQPLYSFQVQAGHAYTKWWELYNQSNPEYFALREGGLRTPRKSPEMIKLCITNPGVAQRWLDNATQLLNDEPARVMVSASENDGADFCTCDTCRSWDHPEGPEIWGYVALTDRYVKYWNILARGLRERFGDREVYIGAYAYGPYRTPPIGQRLDANVALGYVGHFPLANDEVRDREQAAWNDWAQKIDGPMFFRPNLFHYSGGFWGLPNLAVRRTIADFRFLAQHKCIGLQVDSLPLVWATQGVQFYVMAKMAYDPMGDVEGAMTDYYQRGFGPAAQAVRQYHELMEAGHERVLAQIAHSSAKAREAVAIYRDAWNEQVMNQGAALLDTAAAQVAAGPKVYQDRVAFVRVGCDFTRLQIQVADAMAAVRDCNGADRQLVQKAVDLCAQRDRLMAANYENMALRRAKAYEESRKMGDYLGPVSDTFLQAAGLPTSTPKPQP
jgi:hypothetical protein